MAREVGRLKAVEVGRIKQPGMHHDGGGLYLQVTPSGGKTWIYRYTLGGRTREMGLGPLHTFSLAEARQRALEARKLRHDGIDPIEARNEKAATARRAGANAKTFSQCAEGCFAAHKAGWRNKTHTAQWKSTLDSYVLPVLGDLPVSAIDTALVMKVLEPIWTTKTVTASRVRGRIEAVLDWAKAHKYREGENPGRWRGHLDQLLPKGSKVAPVQHHPALPYVEIGAFVELLRDQAGTAARALEFLILTAARTGEVLGARWDEISGTTWTVPPQRIKGGKEHRVPLSRPALAILESLEKLGHEEFIFPGARRGKPLSKMALIALLRRMGRADITPHGFRSTFRDWAAETTTYPREVAEMALAHVIPDQVEAAYRRGNLFERRRQMMEEWAAFCQPGDEGDGATT